MANWFFSGTAGKECTAAVQYPGATALEAADIAAAVAGVVPGRGWCVPEPCS